jgi:hypothetical protein
MGGLAWLEQQIASNQYSFNYPKVIVRAIPRAQSFTELTQWTSCLRGCLMMPRKGRSLLSISYWERVSDEFGPVVIAQRKLRAPDSFTMVPSVQSRYIKALSELEWNDWRDYMQVLGRGVERGFMFDKDPRFLRDPDSICGRY